MKRRKFDLQALPGKAAAGVDDRFQVATPLRRLLNKVFPDHWSFLLGEIALFSFIMLLLTGVVPDPVLRPVDDRRSCTTAATRRCAGIDDVARRTTPR